MKLNTNSSVGFTRRNFLLTSSASCLVFLGSKTKAFASDFYKPRFFTPEEIQFLEAASECIFPEDHNGPGAKALQVAKYIDIQMTLPYGFGEKTYMTGPFPQGPSNLGYQLPYTPRDLYKKAIAAVNKWVVENADNANVQSFKDLPVADQIQALSQLQANAIQLDDIPSVTFFKILRGNVLEGVFADPLYGGNVQMQGWKFIGFPGARADFMQFVDQKGAPYPYGPVGISLSLPQMQTLWKNMEDAQQ